MFGTLPKEAILFFVHSRFPVLEFSGFSLFETLWATVLQKPGYCSWYFILALEAALTYGCFWVLTRLQILALLTNTLLICPFFHVFLLSVFRDMTSSAYLI